MSQRRKWKIALLSMGGTIFSVVEHNVVRVANDIQELLGLVPKIGDVADLSFEVVANLDSTNVAVSEWMLLLGRIREIYDEYDAFVIAHGTNTMAYTASAMSFGLGPGITKPVVFTGSQLPLTAYGNDARFNLEHAVATAVTALEENVAEVMICFHDLVLRANRTVKVSESDFRAFFSPAIDPLARITANGILFGGHVRRKLTDIYLPLVNSGFSDAVVCIDLVPGLHPNIMRKLADGDIKGIIIKSHGAGSVPDQGEMSLIPVIKELTERGISVVVATKFLGGNSFKVTNDEPAVHALQAGAISSHDMTDVAALVKLMHMLASGANQPMVAANFAKQYVGEVS